MVQFASGSVANNGEIADPPATEASPESRPPQYAQPLSRPRSDRSSDPSIFCSRCLKNQYLLTETLASYLPPPSHPEYEIYEASYPAYRKSLEERYPQVCENCEPRVIERIRQAGYAAKADHLRRMMEQSRGGRAVRSKRKWMWRRVFVSTGAVAFWTSVAGQISWNLVGFVVDIAPLAENQRHIQLSKSLLRSCWDQGVKYGRIPSECALALQPYTGLSLVLGVISLWWNPKLRYKVDGRCGGISGVREYYRIQLITLVVRFIAWTVLQDSSITGLNPRLSPAIHAFMGLFTVVVSFVALRSSWPHIVNTMQTTIASRSAIQFSMKPLVSWSDSIEPLLAKPAGNKEDLTQMLSNSQTSTSNPSQNAQRFPIANLAPARAASPESYVLPTPPPDLADDSDAMDWTPSQKTLQPSFHVRRIEPESITAPSPFQGRLPPPPKPPSWQLRNPESLPSVQSIGNKPNPFHIAPILQPTSNVPQKSQIVMKPSDMVMAPPKFFPQSDLNAETGLESLFDKAFSIGDGPAKVKRGLASNTVDGNLAANKPLHILKSTFLGLCLALWLGYLSFGLPRNATETIVLGLSFLVAGFSLLELLMRPMVTWKMTDIFLSLAELIGCVCLALMRTGQFGDQTVFDKAGIYLVAFLMGQEIFGLRSLFGSTKTVVTTQDSVKQEHKRPVSPPLISRSLSTTSGERTPTRSSFISNHAPSNIVNQPAARSQVHSFKAPSVFQPLIPNSNITNRENAFNPLPKPACPPSLPGSFASTTQSQLLSSSFGSTERFMSPVSTTSVSSADYDASTISEPPSPEPSNRHRTPGPSITGLSLEDSPMSVKSFAPTPRYSLRSRRR
ncbi:hypothetical protein PRK78_000856 [Emydomyces testavorans]|uniref:Ima1 N-terminal domain-containing protein n=1 Tax=Emydomyces testavorans TaxID=2070801 RepID=A0AAF0DBX1_9EURO|nr:hypothetical protein PRK78_000856 [Emydomyces testavorans]